MNNLLSNFDFMLVIIFFAIIIVFLPHSKRGKYQYKKRQALFSPAEINFKNSLNRIITNPNLVIYGKVRIADIITPSMNRKFNSKMWWKAFTKISSKHVDYVICDRRNYSVLCVIELDDKSHNTNRAKQRDSFVNQAYHSAGVELVRVKASTRYQPNELLRLFSTNIQNSFQGK